MPRETTLPGALQEGGDALAALPRIERLGRWQWHQATGHFLLAFRASLSAPASAFVPAETDWILRARPQYPAGEILIHPAVDGGLTKTFAHQSYNGVDPNDVLWRKGKPCLEDHALRLDHEIEPTVASDRLVWWARRLLQWLDRAAQDRLLMPGDPTEFPELPSVRSQPQVLAFSEDAISFLKWKAVGSGFGTVEAETLEANNGIWIIRQFRAADGSVVWQPQWGAAVRAGQKPITGIWVTLPELPTIPPWSLPETWGDLQEVAARLRAPIMDVVLANAPQFRTGNAHPLLLGAPVPERVGGNPVRMHWLGLMLPVLSSGTKTARGFRTNEKGYVQRDRSLFSHMKRLEWMTTANWAMDQIASRGAPIASLENAGILMLGAGALGAPVAELIVRGGARLIEVMDGDTLHIGNLVRHPLGLEDLGKGKASRLVSRLNLMSPHVCAVALVGKFPDDAGQYAARIAACNVVIDCTGNDGVLDAMRDHEWNSEKLFVSLSLGWRARRLYCFASRGTHFPRSDFRERFAPWAAREISERKVAGDDAPWEAIGCWHPVFPASGADVALMAAVAVKFVQRALTSDIGRVFSVYERAGEDGAFEGIKEVQSEVGEAGPRPSGHSLLVA
jgi:ThiF family